jgi:hypothetical protein
MSGVSIVIFVNFVVNVCGHRGMSGMSVMGRTTAAGLTYRPSFLANEAAMFHCLNDGAGRCLTGVVGNFDDTAGAVEAYAVDA